MNSVSRDLEQLARSCADSIRQSWWQHTHPNYGILLIHALWQARLCGYDRVTAMEFGVASGRGMTALRSWVNQLAPQFGVVVDVVGFDTGHGLPTAQDYRDHPEIWQAGDYSSQCGDPGMIFGDVAHTVPAWIQNNLNTIIGFVSLDLDLYSSTQSALDIFRMPASCYLPTVLVHLDDAHTHITQNAWAGAELAITEFNSVETLRKFEQKHRRWNLDNFYALHVLDHPFRNGIKPPQPINCSPI